MWRATRTLPSFRSAVPAGISTRAMTTSSAGFRRIVRSAAWSMAESPRRDPILGRIGARRSVPAFYNALAAHRRARELLAQRLDFLRRGCLARERALCLAVPVARVRRVALEHVHDAVRPA